MFIGYGIAGNRVSNRIPGTSHAGRIAPSREGVEHTAWLVPQYRHHIGGERENGYQREGQQQVLRPSFEGIRDSVRDLLGRSVIVYSERNSAASFSSGEEKGAGRAGLSF